MPPFLHPPVGRSLPPMSYAGFRETSFGTVETRRFLSRAGGHQNACHFDLQPAGGIGEGLVEPRGRSSFTRRSEGEFMGSKSVQMVVTVKSAQPLAAVISWLHEQVRSPRIRCNPLLACWRPTSLGRLALRPLGRPTYCTNKSLLELYIEKQTQFPYKELTTLIGKVYLRTTVQDTVLVQ